MAIWRLTVLPAGFASLFSIGLLAAPVAQAAEAAATASSEKEVSTKAAQGAGNASAGKGNVWHLLDVPAVVCAGAPGLAAVPFTLTGNASTPHIISVFRTSGKNATITIAVNASGSVVLPPTNVTLHGFHEDRRLSDSDADLDLQALQGAQALADDADCEAFFMLDGHSPVDLPETFGEARAAFREACQADSATDCAEAEAGLFEAEGPEEEGAALEGLAAAALCSRLLAWSVGSPDAGELSGRRLALQGRRLKGGLGGASHAGVGGGRYYGGGQRPHYIVGGATAQAAFMNPMGRHVGLYAYSDRYMTSAYHGGAIHTGYGYAGRAAMPAAGVAVAMAFGTGFAGGYAFSRLGGLHRSANCSGGECRRRVVLKEQVFRDDLMLTGFVPAEHVAPFTLTLLAVDGEDFAPDRICPPPGWDAAASAAGGAGAAAASGAKPRPPLGQSLFFALTPVERVLPAPVDDMPMSTYAIAVCSFLCLALCCIRAGREFFCRCCLSCCEGDDDEGGAREYRAVRLCNRCPEGHLVEMRQVRMQESELCRVCQTFAETGDFVAHCGFCGVTVCNDCAFEAMRLQSPHTAEPLADAVDLKGHGVAQGKLVMGHPIPMDGAVAQKSPPPSSMGKSMCAE